MNSVVLYVSFICLSVGCCLLTRSLPVIDHVGILVAEVASLEKEAPAPAVKAEPAPVSKEISPPEGNICSFTYAPLLCLSSTLKLF